MRKTMTYINMNIDLDEIIDGLSSYEKQELVDELYQDGFYQKELEKQIEGFYDYDNASLNEQMFREQLAKISSNYLSLTNEEQEIILKISKRF
jgi:hypothetical protein